MLRLLAGLALAAAAAPALAQMEPGHWEFDSVTTSPLLAAPQRVTFNRCIRKEDAEQPHRWMSDPGQSDCKLTPGKRTADTFTWQLACPKTNLRGTGSARMAGATFEGEQNMAGEAQGRKFELRTKVTGKRTGPCAN